MASEPIHHSTTLAKDDGWYIKRRYFLRFLEGFADTQIGPIYLGYWGAMAGMFFVAAVFLILMGYLHTVAWNPVRFLREFPILAVYPPDASYGLTMAPLAKGGYWQAATLFLTACVFSWSVRIFSRARAHKLRPMVAIAWSSAVFLFAVIYIIHPAQVGTWSEAPGHGLKAQLDWVNYFSIKYGNFYYNPFHMVSIFFLLGSTVLLGMHGATILATLHLNSHRELDEVEDTTEGTQRAQLFWRWVMGFNATAHSIHVWSMAFGVMTVLTGAIGVLASGWFEPDWFAWACRAGIAPSPALACPAP
jgi:photosynthetic reaction center M subunit